jgi:hypothetical protein
MTDRYARIRQALAMRPTPTPGPWEVVNGTDIFTPLGARNAAGVEAVADDGWHIADCDTGPSYTKEGKEEIPYAEKRANAALIAACDPDTIRALLDERDRLAAENEALREEVERLRTDGASAVRWAPGSAYWSEVLVELFGPDARKGIDVLETRWRKELERAERLAEALRELEERGPHRIIFNH